MSDRTRLTGEHAWIEERLSAYIDNQLSSGERARLERHLDGCGECRASLESLRWTVALVRQAPAPVSPRSFTLAQSAAASLDARSHVPRRMPTFAFGAASFATALTSLLLVVVVGLDAVLRLGAGYGASNPLAAPVAPGAAFESARPTSVALAPQIAPSEQPPSTSAPEPLLAPAAAAPPATATPPVGLAQVAPPAPQATQSFGRGGGAPETAVPNDTLQGAAQPLATPATAPGAGQPPPATPKSESSGAPAASAGPTVAATRSSVTALQPRSSPSTLPTNPAAAKAAVAPTPTLAERTSAPAPTLAERTVAPTPTPAEPTVSPPPPASSAADSSRINSAETGIPPLRAVEFGLLVLALIFGATAVVLWRTR